MKFVNLSLIDLNLSFIDLSENHFKLHNFRTNKHYIEWILLLIL